MAAPPQEWGEMIRYYAAPRPDVGMTSTHQWMSAGTVLALIVLAFLVDFMSMGPGSIRDRLAFCMALPAFYVGFSGSPLAAYTTNLLGSWINGAKAASHGAYIAQVGTRWTVGMIVGVVFIYCMGVLMPVRWASRFGGWARFAFGSNQEFGEVGGVAQRINWRLWACAFFLGLLGDLPQGLVGSALRGFLGLLSPLVAFLPNLIFGGNG